MVGGSFKLAGDARHEPEDLADGCQQESLEADGDAGNDAGKRQYAREVWNEAEWGRRGGRGGFMKPLTREADSEHNHDDAHDHEDHSGDASKAFHNVPPVLL